MEGSELLRQLGASIKSHRMAKDLTQSQLAEAVQLEQATISRYERGLVMPTLNSLYDIAKVLNVPIAELFERHPSDDVNARAAEIARLIENLPSQDRADLTKLVQDMVSLLKRKRRT